MTKIKYLPILNAVILLIIITYSTFSYLQKSEKKLVYVDNVKLFNEFNMTKEIKSVEEKKINQLKTELDRLYLELRSSATKGEATEDKERTLRLKRDSLARIQENYRTKLTSQIWERINAYVSLYGSRNKVHIILGSTGSGNIMYANKAIDITPTVLEFINKTYEGL